MKRLLCLVVCLLLVFNVVRVAMQLQRDPTLPKEEREYLSVETLFQILSKYEFSVGDSFNKFAELYDTYCSEYYAYREYMEDTTWFERIFNHFWERTELSDEWVFNKETGKLEKVEVDYPDPVKYSLGFYDALFAFLEAFVLDVLTFLDISADLLFTLFGFREYALTA